mmetsp:Transcript_14369/g.30419  ORF Transcript_14369/g.30419 Transcript_14369/m.30419 type:complete len:89 (-) Transcript_14369:348-614(-)
MGRRAAPVGRVSEARSIATHTMSGWPRLTQQHHRRALYFGGAHALQTQRPLISKEDSGTMMPFARNSRNDHEVRAKVGRDLFAAEFAT